MKFDNSKKQPGFLQKTFKDPLFDHSVFGAADLFIDGYCGGWWEPVETESGAAFMMLKGNPDSVVIRPSTGEGLLVNGHLAGMIVTYCVLSGMVQEGRNDVMQIFCKLKVAIADYCIELERGDVLEALLS